MHAVVGRSTIDDADTVVAFLEENVLPRLPHVPGFIAGYWVALEDGAGASMMLFDSEAAAREAMAKINPPPGVTLISREVGEVIAGTTAAAGP